jgi:hypothetical protein
LKTDISEQLFGRERAGPYPERLTIVHGVYWTPSPIFLHAEPCERFEQTDIVPEIVRHRLVSVRTYDADDMCIYELGDVCDGTDVEQLLDRALADRRTDYVKIHTARPGCFLCRVERV